jgi:hypothetical protein
MGGSEMIQVTGFHVPEHCRVRNGVLGSDVSYGNNGLFIFRLKQNGQKVHVICSDGMGWEHVSVSMESRCPTWQEMCEIKDTFWGPEDCVVQYHPPKSQYVNNHPHCLHLWRKVGGDFERPPSFMVGKKETA